MSKSFDHADVSGGCSATFDHLTNLLVDLRHKILTFLSLKDAIRTGALSRQWLDLWRERWLHEASLDLSVSHDTDPTTYPSAFITEADRKLDSQKPLDTLRIAFWPSSGRRGDPNIMRWLDLASNRGVEVLYLDLAPISSVSVFSSSGRRPIPALHFCSDATLLAHLTLCNLRLTTPLRHFRRLFCLEILNLHWVSISDTVLGRIVADLPLLRVLDLRYSPNLKKVRLLGYRIVRLTILNCTKLFELTVTSPVLHTLHFKGGFLYKCSIPYYRQLKDCYMNCSGPEGVMPQNNWYMDIEPFSNLQILTLSDQSLQCITASDVLMTRDLRKFENLQELQLLMGQMYHSNLADIYNFFLGWHCPDLERLFIQMGNATMDIFVVDATMNSMLERAEEAPQNDCLQQLKKVKINNFKGHAIEIRLVKFILSRAPNLEYLMIVASWKHIGEPYSKDHYERYTAYIYSLHLKMSVIERASAKLRITWSDTDNDPFRPKHDVVISKFSR